ncbi:MAG: PepSY domain-containing protein [Candidatus Contendobacter sp.]|nr:PepSY domain-containing protein [Candidatus Contendobacter sp.]RUQ28499.1 MAG: hypothetical protein EKK68_14430 [Candidatus Competibacteraceae bacterium]
MIIRKPLFTALALAVSFTAASAFAAGETPAAPMAAPMAATAPAAPITKEQATEMALKAHPGKVTKAYEDSHKGKKTWEIKITGDDGKKWEVYYEIATGALVDEKSK